jgi:hypothetical protein
VERPEELGLAVDHLGQAPVHVDADLLHLLGRGRRLHHGPSRRALAEETEDGGDEAEHDGQRGDYGQDRGHGVRLRTVHGDHGHTRWMARHAKPA